MLAAVFVGAAASLPRGAQRQLQPHLLTSSLTSSTPSSSEDAKVYVEKVSTKLTTDLLECFQERFGHAAWEEESEAEMREASSASFLIDREATADLGHLYRQELLGATSLFQSGRRVVNERRSSAADNAYDTAQYLADVWLHESFAQHDRRTDDPEEADVIFVPFYVTLSHRLGYCRGLSNHGERIKLLAKTIRRSPNFRLASRFLLAFPDVSIAPTLRFAGKHGPLLLALVKEAGIRMATVDPDYLHLADRMNDECRWSGDAELEWMKRYCVPGWNSSFLQNVTSDRDPARRVFVIPYVSNLAFISTESERRILRRAPRTNFVLFRGNSNLACCSWKEPSCGCWLRNTIVNESIDRDSVTGLPGNLVVVATDRKKRNDPGSSRLFSARDYVDEMLSSTYCLVPRGDTRSSRRLFEAVAAGCIPVIVSDDLVLPFSSSIDWSKISVQIPEAEFNRDPLRAYQALAERLDEVEMRSALLKARQGLLYAEHGKKGRNGRPRACCGGVADLLLKEMAQPRTSPRLLVKEMPPWGEDMPDKLPDPVAAKTDLYANCVAETDQMLYEEATRRQTSGLRWKAPPGEIAVLQFDTRVDEEPYKSIFQHNQGYCEQHGYDYRVFTQRRLSDDWDSSWERVPALLDELQNPNRSFVMWLDSDALFYNTDHLLETVIAAGGLMDGSAFILGGDNSPVWQEKDPILCGGALIFNAKDERSKMLLHYMMEHSETLKKDGYKKTWPVDQHVMNVILDENEMLRRGRRMLPFCAMAGTDCQSTTIAELTNARQSPFIYHCMRFSGDSKDNLPRILESAHQLQQADERKNITLSPPMEYVVFVTRQRSAGSVLPNALVADMPGWRSLYCNEIFHVFANQTSEECIQLVTDETFRTRNQELKRLETVRAMRNSLCSTVPVPTYCFVSFELFDFHVLFQPGEKMLAAPAADLLLHPGARVIVLERNAKEEECSLQWAKKENDYASRPQIHRPGYELFKESCLQTPVAPEFQRAHNAWYAAVRSTLRNASKPFMDVSSADLFERYGQTFDSVFDFITDFNTNENIKAAREQMRYAFVKGVYRDNQTPAGWMMQDES
jgi:hypothetical protein